MEGKIWEKILRLQKKNDGVIDDKRTTLVRWNDRGEKMNQEEADQDVADEVSEEVDSRGELMRSKNDDCHRSKTLV